MPEIMKDPEAADRSRRRPTRRLERGALHSLSTTFRKRAGWLQHPPTDLPPRLAITSPPDVTETDPGPPPPPLDAPLTSRPGSTSCPQHDEDSDSIRNRKRGWAKHFTTHN